MNEIRTSSAEYIIDSEKLRTKCFDILFEELSTGADALHMKYKKNMSKL